MKAARHGIMFLILSLFALGFVRTDTPPIGRINFILGDQNDILVHYKNSPRWQRARLYSPVYDGTRFKTYKESRCEIKLGKKGIIRIGENADLVLRYNPKKKTNKSVLNKGRFWASLKGFFNRGSFLIRTPTAVCAVRGTVYRIDADSTTKISVYDGKVDVGPAWFADADSVRQAPRQKSLQVYEVPGPTEVPGPFEVSLEQWIQIVAGYQIEVRADGKYYKSKIDTTQDKDDDWVNWNLQRDGQKKF